jgi:hypothetical protein
MAAKTAAQEEFDDIFTHSDRPTHHPEDHSDDENEEEIDEETAYKQGKIAETMRRPVFNDRSAPLRLPPPSFDSGRTTGVKGVIADARSFEAARREGSWKAKVHVSQAHGQEKKLQRGRNRESDNCLVRGDDSDEEEFLEKWREARRKEMMRDGSEIRNRRTSPSIRRYGRFDEVDALGYLDAIEKVGRETVVVVFVYDTEVCPTFPFYSLVGMPSYAAHRQVLFMFLYTTLIAHKLTSFSSTTVRRQPSHRVSAHSPRANQPSHPLRQSQLRRDRIRQRGRPSHLGVQESRGLVCESDVCG